MRRFLLLVVLVVPVLGAHGAVVHAKTVAAVEGTYEYHNVTTSSGTGTKFPNDIWWSGWFSAGTIKQGEPLEFRAVKRYNAWGWCFSYNQYDDQPTSGLNFRTAYSPRGRSHPVASSSEVQRLMVGTAYRSRAWRELTNCGPSCPQGIGTCPYYGSQFHELTGTVPGSETATLKPGCYVLETDWEYGSGAPLPESAEQRESGSLPQFCVQSAGTTQPPPPGQPPVPNAPSPRAAGALGDIGVSCGTTRFAWHYVTKEPTMVKKGEFACIVLLSNRVSRGLIELALAGRWTIAEAYLRTHYDSLRGAPSMLEKPTDSLWKIAMKRAFPKAATTMSRLNVLFSFGKLSGYHATAMTALFVLGQYTTKGACGQFVVDPDAGRIRADWSLVYNPQYFKGVNGTYASTWQLQERTARMDTVTRRFAPLRCDSNGQIVRGRGDSLFTNGRTQIITGA